MRTVLLPRAVSPIAVNKRIYVNIKFKKWACTGLEVDAALRRASWETSGALCAPRINCFSLPHESHFSSLQFVLTPFSPSPSLPPPLSLPPSYLKGLQYFAFWRCFMIYYLPRISKQVTFPQCSARSNIPIQISLQTPAVCSFAKLSATC